MWFLRLALVAAAVYGGEALPVIPLQWTPDQIAQSLRTTKPPMPVPDCAALSIFACKLEYPMPVRDISIRWVQLDDDPELEAIILAHGESERDYFAFVFDWNRKWNLVGSFDCYQRCAGGGMNFVRVEKLTENAPMFIVVRRDQGGSGSSYDRATFVYLRAGRLKESFEAKILDTHFLPPPTHIESDELLSSGRWLIQHTTREEPLPVTHTCKVLTWSNQEFKFQPAPAQNINFCDPRTGRPLPDKAYKTNAY